MDTDKYIGRLLDNRYEILEVIGTGGMAVVYKARCHRLNRLVAIKILKDDNLDDEDFRRRFHAESQAVAMLSHPNIVSVYDVSTSIMADYIVMELIEGITLKQYMEKKGILNWKETLHFAIQIAKALEHAHSKGIVHRDIKPHNIMVLKNGSVKVMDFGIARMISRGNTLTKEALGSVHYISPEQAKGGRVDDRSDIYSLGVVMYEMMAGRPPYDGESPVAVAIQHINGGAALPSVLNPNIPGGLEQIIMKAMAHNVSDRYTSATRMLSDMDEFRKDPTMLFDYTGVTIDAVMRVQKPPLVLQPPVTTAERVARGQNPRTGSKPSVVSERRLEAERRRRQLEEEKRSRVTTIAIISCSFVAVVAIVIFMIILLGGGFVPEEKLVEVPYLVGESYQDLQNYPGLVIMKEERYHESVEAGKIISQNLEAGREVVEGTKIVVNVSLGPEPQIITMGNLVERTREWAYFFLNNLDLDLDIVVKQEFHDSIVEGIIIRTEPQQGVELTKGQTVTLWVSKGKEIKFASMPNVQNEEKSAAIKTLDLQNLDLSYTFEEIHDSEIKVGNVVKTEPGRGEKLQTGQTVKLYISKGPKKEIMPGVVGMDIGNAYTVLKTAGFKTPTIEYVDSDAPKDTVVGQSLEKGLEYEVTVDIVLEVSNGPKNSGPQEPEIITKNIVFDLRNSAIDAECRVSIYRDGAVIYSEKVPQGTPSVTLTGQTGTGVVTYSIIINDHDGWEIMEDFSANG